jgi:hypothetical protein
MRARWYDPHLGRFLSEDPIGLAGGINPYVYANNNPNNLRDPSGLFAASGGCWIELGYTGWTRGCDVGGSGGSLGYFGYSGGMWAGPPPGPGNPAVPGSTCDVEGCVLRNPRGSERARVPGALAEVRHDIEFCRRVQSAGVEMIARHLQMWDNVVIDRITKEQIYGNAPHDATRGGPVMYLYSKDFGEHTSHTIVHEAIHGVVMRYDLRGQPMYYPDAKRQRSLFTPLGRIDPAAATCRGR